MKLDYVNSDFLIIHLFFYLEKSADKKIGKSYGSTCKIKFLEECILENDFLKNELLKNMFEIGTK